MFRVIFKEISDIGADFVGVLRPWPAIDQQTHKVDAHDHHDNNGCDAPSVGLEGALLVIVQCNGGPKHVHAPHTSHQR